jgi:hypothetical protein
MTRRFFVWLTALAGAVFSLSGWAKRTAITQDELVRYTQEIFDAVAPGDQAPFKKYFADDVIFSDEKGTTMDKAALVKDIAPCRTDTLEPSRSSARRAALWELPRSSVTISMKPRLSLARK